MTTSQWTFSKYFLQGENLTYKSDLVGNQANQGQLVEPGKGGLWQMIPSSQRVRIIKTSYRTLSDAIIYGQLSV